MYPVMASARGRVMGFLLATVLAVMSLAAPAGAGELPQAQASFSADISIITLGKAVGGKVWHQDGMWRHEIAMQGESHFMIIRPDLEVMYMFMASTNMAIEMPIIPGIASIGAYDIIRTRGLEAVGEETVSGIETTKYRIDQVDESIGKITGHSWITEDGIVVKMESELTALGRVESTRFLLTNVERGSQDPTLFVLPEGLQVTKMP